MRVINPSYAKRQQLVSRSRKLRLVFVVYIICLILIGVYLYRSNSSESYLNKAATTSPGETLNQKSNVPRILSGEEFKQIYNNFHYINTFKILELPEITGNQVADNRIRKLAEDRGYLLRRIARETTGVADGHALQRLAEKYWLGLKAAAAKEGIILTVTSGYRSVEDQRDVFLEALRTHGISAEEIAAGNVDSQIDDTLRINAPPGYSRHHTGFTIDLTCGTNGLTNFATTICFEWLSKDNYQNAKTYGWAPSYPEGAGLQGPDPEPWEYAWVTSSALAK